MNKLLMMITSLSLVLPVLAQADLEPNHCQKSFNLSDNTLQGYLDGACSAGRAMKSALEAYDTSKSSVNNPNDGSASRLAFGNTASMMATPVTSPASSAPAPVTTPAATPQSNNKNATNSIFAHS